MKTKVFDCVAMKHKGASKIYEQTKGMTLEQELAWWKKREAATLKRLPKLAHAPSKYT